MEPITQAMTLLAIVQAFATATTLILVLVAIRVADLLAVADDPNRQDGPRRHRQGSVQVR